MVSHVYGYDYYNNNLVLPHSLNNLLRNNPDRQTLQFELNEHFGLDAISPKWKNFKVNFAKEEISINFPSSNIKVQSETNVLINAGVVFENSLYMLNAANPRVNNQTAEEVYEEFIEILSPKIVKQFKIQFHEIDGNHVIDGEGDLGLIDDEQGNSPGIYNQKFRFVFTSNNIYLILSAIDISYDGYHEEFIESFKVYSPY